MERKVQPKGIQVGLPGLESQDGQDFPEREEPRMRGLVSHCWCKESPQPVWLTTTHIFNATVSAGQSLGGTLGLPGLKSSQVSRALPFTWNNPLPSSLGALGEFSSLWPYACGALLLLAQLGAGEWKLPASISCFLCYSPLLAVSQILLISHSIFFHFPPASSQREFFAFKGTCDLIGPTWVTQAYQSGFSREPELTLCVYTYIY